MTKKRILLIEDDVWLADSYERVLKTAGYTVKRASDASSAMRAIERRVPSVIVADVMLRSHTAFALLHELQSYNDTQQIPVVLCSGLADIDKKPDMFAQYGVRTVLAKASLTPASLVRAVEECLL